MSSQANLLILDILILLVGSSLFCIGANKGLHDSFDEEKGHVDFIPIGML